LATNAVKYGALINHDGRIEFSWDMAGKNDGLRLCWQEFSGPLLKEAPGRQGFGSRLINTLVARQLSGSVCFDWHEQGMSCTIELPSRLVMHADLVSSVHSYDMIGVRDSHGALGSAAVTRPDAPTPRVLIVEDEAMLVMELEATLGELGYQVVVAGTLDQAIRLTAAEPNLSAAILDVNLGNDETSFAVVDILQMRRVPYIFVTGYGSAASLGGHDHSAVAVIIKPYPRATLADALRVAIHQVS
jgi:CheY-like chemotaxis protein